MRQDVQDMKERLFTRSYCSILGANFLLYFSFWMLTPILPFYLKDTFTCGNALIGIILSCYTVSALFVRPFSGFLLDTFKRKPLYMLAYFTFFACFIGYILAFTLFVFVSLRIVHGFAFGTVTVGGNTICVDIMPSSRRGEGLGYYGLTNNIAMSVGPMTGLLLKSVVSYNTLFVIALAFCAAGFTLTTLIKCPVKPQVKRPPLSLDRFILIKGIPASIALLLLSIPYGATTNFVAVYAEEIGIKTNTGIFFTLMAAGMGISRLFSGKLVDKGYVCKVISAGFYFVITAFAALAFCAVSKSYSMALTNGIFFTVPMLLGVGFGIMFPAYNSLYINLAPNNQRATATSTYLTAWDLGIGIGVVSGGLIAEHWAFDTVYAFGAVLCVVSMIYFNTHVTRHYSRNSLR